jgi:UDP-2,4-diacetamido-2,4,6-trideoxy-beta-L-altropyranose hydrolase
MDEGVAVGRPTRKTEKRRMTREPILFRVDGTRAAGWEALARCLVLAAAMQRRRRPCHFLSRLEPMTLAGQVKRGDNSWIPADHPVGSHDDFEQLAREVRRARPIAIIVDSPHCTPEYLAELTTLGPLVVSMDQEAQFRFPSQLVIHPALNNSAQDYEVCPGAQVLAGPRYALLRPGIRRVRLVRGQEPQPPLRIVVGFGDDPKNWTKRIVELLLKMPQAQRIDILARAVHPKYPEWAKLAEEHKGRVSLSCETVDQAKRISRCHFAFAEGNHWAMEMACVGVPLLLIVQDEVYWKTAQRLEEEGAANLLGWHEAVNDKTIRMAAENLMNDQAERRQMARCGRAFLDGRGPDRLVSALEIMTYPLRRQEAREAA